MSSAAVVIGALRVNDMPNIFDESCDQVNIADYEFSCLMYKDDIVLLSSSAKGLQISLVKVVICGKYKNLNKITKI